jgi:hypothetical protein
MKARVCITRDCGEFSRASKTDDAGRSVIEQRRIASSAGQSTISGVHPALSHFSADVKFDQQESGHLR